MLIISLLFIFQTQQCYLCVHEARRSRYVHSSIVPHLYFFNCNAAHFDAHLGPGPDIPDSLPHHILVQGQIHFWPPGAHPGCGACISWSPGHRCPRGSCHVGPIRATRRPCDLHIARDHLCPSQTLMSKQWTTSTGSTWPRDWHINCIMQNSVLHPRCQDDE